MSFRGSSRKGALIIAALYLVFGFLWILISDRIVYRLGLDPATFSRQQSMKGLVYVLLTGLLIYGLVRIYLGRVIKVADKLRRSEERFSGLLERLNEAVYRMSLPDGEYEYLSPAFTQVFGYPLERILDGELHIRTVIHPDDRGYLVEKWDELLEGIVPPAYDYRVIDAEGRVRFIHQSNTGIFDETGRIIALEGCCSDVTDLKEAEAERRRMEDRIRQSQKLESLGLLAGGIAHDFNNLLLSMLGNAELALEEVPADSPAVLSIQNIRQAALRASDLSNQMLAYSGSGRFVISVLDMNDLIGELGALFDVNRPPGVELEFDLTADLPPVRADGTQIRQVVLNLLTNAAEACEQGTGRIRLVTSILDHQGALPPADVSEGVLEPGLHVCLEVSDTGSGMSRSTLQRIFDPFYSTKPTGRGLGLAAVLGIVRGHGGAIQVRSRAGDGSTFRLLLPASPEPLAAPSPSVRETPESRGATVLVVDDEESVLDTAGRMLEKQGYAVVKAASGARALELLASRGDSIDVVLLDLTMPDMSGEAVFRALRRQDADLPVVLSSGWSAEESLEGLQALGLSGFLQKPYSLDALAEAIHSALGR